LKKYFIVHTSTIITLIFGVINQLLLVSLLPSSDYGYLAATIGVSLIPVMMTVTSQTNILYENKTGILNNEFNPWAVFIFFLFVAYLASIFLYVIVINNLNLSLIFILLINVLFTSTLEYVSALFVVKEEKPSYIAFSQLSNTLPRTIIYFISLISTSHISLNTVAIAALISFFVFSLIVKDKVCFEKKIFNVTLLEISKFKSLKYGFSNLFLTFVNQSPILISLRIIGPEFSGTVAFTLYMFNFLWSIPADVYKRYRLDHFHQFIKKNNGIKKLFSFKELFLITIIAFIVSIFTFLIISNQFVSITIESFKQHSSYLILLLLIGLPFRYASIYLSSLMLNSLYTKFRTISLFTTLFFAIISYTFGALYMGQDQYIKLIILVEIVMFLLLFTTIKIVIKREKSTN
jgi:hypothetical protein